jgi:hypothetical protein
VGILESLAFPKKSTSDQYQTAGYQKSKRRQEDQATSSGRNDGSKVR